MKLKSIEINGQTLEAQTETKLYVEGQLKLIGEIIFDIKDVNGIELPIGLKIDGLTFNGQDFALGIVSRHENNSIVIDVYN